MIFKPTKELLAIDKEWREQWARALDTSKQGRNALVQDDGGMCCLAVLEHLHGRSVEEMRGHAVPGGLPQPARMPSGRLPQRIKAAIDEKGSRYSFASLNDELLTHEQIARLLRGEEVTVVEAIEEGK